MKNEVRTEIRIPFLFRQAAWSSPDGIAHIVRSDDSSRLVVSVDGLLEVELSRGEDAELRDEPGGPPVRYINLAVKGLVVSPEVHGVSPRAILS